MPEVVLHSLSFYHSPTELSYLNEYLWCLGMNLEAVLLTHGKELFDGVHKLVYTGSV